MLVLELGGQALADHVRIVTNHPKQRLVTIPVSGFVRPVIAVTPASADFGQVELKEPLTRTLNVRNFATEAIKITAADSTVAGMKTAIEPVQDGREYTIKVTLASGMPKGPFQGTITLRTDSPKKPAITVPIEGSVI